MYDGVIIREVPEIDNFVTDPWTLAEDCRHGRTRTAPVFLCGQQAVDVCLGQDGNADIPRSDRLPVRQGVGVKMCYGVAKTFRKYTRVDAVTGVPVVAPPVAGADNLIQTGMVTGFFSSVNPT